jgi:uncharacterized membrane protein
MGLPALAIVVGAAVVTGLIAVPLALRKVPPNRLYGIRTRRTLADDAVWYETNAYGGRCLIVASAVTIVAVAILAMLLPDAMQVPAVLAALVVPSLVAALLAVRHAGQPRP